MHPQFVYTELWLGSCVGVVSCCVLAVVSKVAVKIMFAVSPKQIFSKLHQVTLRLVRNIVSPISELIFSREVFSRALTHSTHALYVSLNLLQESICRNHLPNVVSCAKSAYSA